MNETMKLITSRNNLLIKELVMLKKKANRDQRQLFLAEGHHLVEMAASAGLVQAIFALDEKDKVSGIPFYLVSEEVMKKLTTLTSMPSIIALTAYPTLPFPTSGQIIYLDGVQDPGNVGTIIRTALALNFAGVIASPECADFFNAKTLMAAQGSVFHLPIMRMNQLTALDFFHNHGYQIIVSSLKASKDISQVKANFSYVLVIGSEGQGISDLMDKNADERVIIPISQMESLNASIAAAIMMYALQRH